MVKPRSEKELELMRESGRITSLVLKKVLEEIKVGVTGLELDKIAEEEIKRLGGEPSFKTVPGYHYAICITFNEEVVHGVPSERKIKEGDVVSIDTGAVFKGWHTDSAWTVLVGQDQGKEKFLQVGQEALKLGIEQAVAGNKIGDISCAIQNKVEGGGYGVVRSLVGHGVGRDLHEEPEIPGYGRPGRGLKLKPGMTLAIEVIYTQGNFEVVVDGDGWTISTADQSLSGLFEISIIVGKSEAEILTYPIVG
ncbi:MAG: type I methionyl aminopeptidase [Candidatus Daviesbacteria bacterium]|nr:MAG: type I methionyl aminopeptidase [Candidatus Daviesbacteria bacterium]